VTTNELIKLLRAADPDGEKPVGFYEDEEATVLAPIAVVAYPQFSVVFLQIEGVLEDAQKPGAVLN
jgi:hypothetical protein